jgi:hypothetical protein
MANRVLDAIKGWLDLLEEVAREAEIRFGSLTPFTAGDIAALVGLSFLGGESIILLGDEDWTDRVRGALRRVGDLIRTFEEADGELRPRRARARAR